MTLKVYQVLVGFLFLALVFCCAQHSLAMTFEARRNLLSIQGEQVSMKDVLSRIAREAHSDIFLYGKRDQRLDLSIKGKNVSEALRLILRGFSYAVIHNVGREGKVFFLEKGEGSIPEIASYEDDETQIVSFDVGGQEDLDLSKREKDIQRIEHFIDNMERRIESGRSDELYEIQVRERGRDPETVTHDREKLERLKKKLEKLRYGQ